MFLLCKEEGYNCLYLTPKSLQQDYHIQEYFENLHEDHEGHQFDFFRQKVQWTIANFVKSCTSKCYFFVDLSFISDNEETHRPGDLLNTIIQYTVDPKVKMILSLSSGVNNSRLTNIQKLTFSNIINHNCNEMSITSFTEQEAHFYLSGKNSKLKIEQIKSISGTNPLLLSIAISQSELLYYDYLARQMVREFLKKNFGFNTEASNYELHKHFLTIQVSNSIRYARYAANQATVCKTDLGKDYYDSWVWSNQLILLTEIHDDTTSSTEDLTNEEREEITGRLKLDIDDEEQTKYKVTWNMPICGEVFLNVLYTFFTNNDENLIKETCRKEMGFAGYWLEAKFFEFCSGQEAILSVRCVEVNRVTERGSIDCVFEISNATREYKTGETTKLLLKTLYELRSCHPIIDFIGYLQDSNSNTMWLVFIQISLMKYSNHKAQLGNIFKRNPMKGTTPKELKNCSQLSYYSYYRIFQVVTLMFFYCISHHKK